MKLLRILFAPVVLLAVAAGLTGCTNITPGNAGIEISKTGASRGVQDLSLKTGFVIYNPLVTDIVEYPYTMQTKKWTKDVSEGNPSDESITFTTKDSAVVNCDLASSIELDYDKVPAFYLKFRAHDIESFLDGYYRNVVRNQLNNVGGEFNVEQVMGDNGPLLKRVEEAVQNDESIKQYGVKITNLGFIGACRPPQVVTDSINAKLGAQQLALQKQNEIVQAEAEAKKQEAFAQGRAQSNIIEAEADAKANALRSNSLTPQLIQWNAIMKWNGQRPQVEGNGSGLIMNLNK